MAKIKNFSKKANGTRVRMRRMRERKKKREIHENWVREFKQNIENNELNMDNILSDSTTMVYCNDQEQFCLESELRKWSNKYNIASCALSDLLKILIRSGNTFLPMDARTLKKTPQCINIFTMGNGKYWYRSIRTCLYQALYKLNRNVAIHLNFNFDGLPLFNSSTLNFWPILMSIRGIFSLNLIRYKYLMEHIFLRISTNSSNGRSDLVWQW